MANILVVDDDERICSAFAELLTLDGHAARIASSGDEALELVAQRSPDLVLMDIRMPGTDGLEALSRIRQLDPQLHVIMMTAFGTSQAAIDAMRAGAFDYLTKPIELESLRAVIRRALEAGQLVRAAGSDPKEIGGRISLLGLVGSSPRMQEAYKRIGLLASNSSPALLVGEPGTGRRLTARTIHFNSPRKSGPFLELRARGVAPDQIERELFGRVEGGVSAPGKLESASGGSLYLADLDELPMPLQAQLSAYLADGSFEKPGRYTTVKADARILASTSHDLDELTREGRFSETLLLRLGVLPIRLPPLRERLEDLPDLVAHAISRSGHELGKSLQGVDDRVMAAFRAHTWPGNVGELMMVVRSGAVRARNEVIGLEQVADRLSGRRVAHRQSTESSVELAVRRALAAILEEDDAQARERPFHHIVGAVERILVEKALEETRGNQVKAAKLLGLNRTTLRKKMGR